jgi:hypothetical protein
MLVAVLTFVYGLKRLAASGWQVVPLVAVAVAGLAGDLFLRRQRRAAQPLLDLGLFRDVRVSVALVANGLSFFVLYGTQFAIAQYLQLVLGMSPLRAGLWALPPVLAYLLPAVVAGAVIFSAGLAPAYILSTDLVVSTVRPDRAGMAAAVTETAPSWAAPSASPSWVDGRRRLPPHAAGHAGRRDHPGGDPPAGRRGPAAAGGAAGVRQCLRPDVAGRRGGGGRGRRPGRRVCAAHPGKPPVAPAFTSDGYHSLLNR